MTSSPATVLMAVLVAGALAACGSAGQEDDEPSSPVAASGAPDAQEVTVLGTEGLDYQPSAITASVGKLTLTLANEGGPPHDLVFSDDALPAIAAVSEGQEASATYVFAGAGTYDFVCTFHPGMSGRVVVE